MVNINALKTRYEFVSNQTQQGGVGPDQFNELAKFASYSLWLNRIGLPELADFATGVPKIAYARTKKIHFDLEPFKDKRIVNVSSGRLLLSALSEDCYISNIRAVSYVKEIQSLAECDDGCESALTDAETLVKYRKSTADIDIIDEARWSYRTRSTIIKTDFCCPYNTYLEFYFHSQVSQVEVTYLKKPVSPIWNFTDVNGGLVYNPAGSVHLEWSELLIDSLAARMVKEYSKYTSDQPGMVYADAKMKEGQ